MRRFVAAFAIMVLMCSCATVLKGNARTVRLGTNSTHAKVYVDGEYIGQAPLKMKLSNDRDHKIKICSTRKDCKTYTIRRKFDAGWLLLDIILSGGTFIPVIVDAVTGAWYELEPNEVE